MTQAIQRKVILPPVKQNLGLISLAITIVLVVSLVLIKALPFAALGVVLSLPIWFVIWYGLSVLNAFNTFYGYGDRARQALIAYIGKAPKYIDVAGTVTKSPRGAATGTGIAVTEDCFYVLDEGEVACIPFAAVRSWEWKTAGYVQYQSNTLSESAVMPLRNQKNMADANMESGLFVSVKDIEKPIWQFRTTDERILQKWDEIFRQVLEQSTVASATSV